MGFGVHEREARVNGKTRIYRRVSESGSIMDVQLLRPFRDAHIQHRFVNGKHSRTSACTLIRRHMLMTTINQQQPVHAEEPNQQYS